MSYSIVRTGGSDVDHSADLRGLSTDTLPTAANGDDVAHGSTYFCMDTGACFMYKRKNVSVNVSVKLLYIIWCQDFCNLIL